MKMRQILIVEDVEMIADFMNLVLSRHGYEVTGVIASGEDAVTAALTTAPDLVLMDIRLEGFIDGIEAAARIRKRSDTPIVFVSAHTDTGIIYKAMATGASGYLIKPFKGKDLLYAIERALKGQEAGGLPGEAFTVNHPCAISRTESC